MAEATALPGARRLRFRIVTALALGFLAVALLAGAAFTITVLGASDSTQRLLLDRNRRMVDSQAQFVRDRLDPVLGELNLIAVLAERGQLDAGSPTQITAALHVLMEDLPEVSGAGFAGLDGVVHRILRGPDHRRVE